MKVHELISQLSKADPNMDIHAAAMITVPDGGTLDSATGDLSEPDESGGGPKMHHIPNMMKTFEVTAVSEGGKIEGPRVVIIGFEVPVPDVLDDDLIG